MIRRVPSSAEDAGVDRPVAVLGDPALVAAVIQRLGDDTTTNVWSTFPSGASFHNGTCIRRHPSEAARGSGIVLLVAPDDDLAEVILFSGRRQVGRRPRRRRSDGRGRPVLPEVWVTRALASLPCVLAGIVRRFADHGWRDPVVAAGGTDPQIGQRAPCW